MNTPKEHSPCTKCNMGQLISISDKQQIISMGELIEVPAFQTYECTHCRRVTLFAKEIQRAMQYLDHYHYSYSNPPFELYPVKTSKIAAMC